MSESTYPNLHQHKSSWLYSEVYNVGLFFNDFKEHLNKENTDEAKNVLKKCLHDFYFKPITLHFENVQLIIENVDNADNTLQELEKLKF